MVIVVTWLGSDRIRGSAGFGPVMGKIAGDPMQE